MGLEIGATLPDFEGIFDDVGGAVESIELLDGDLELLRGLTIRLVHEDGVHGGLQAFLVELAARDDYACSTSGHAGGDSGLVVANGNADQGYAFGEGLERGVNAGVGDDDGCAFDEIELRRVFDDDGIAGEGAEAFTVEARAKRHDQLHRQLGAGGGNGLEDAFRPVLERTERGVDEGTAIELVPGEVDLGALQRIDEGAGVMKEGMAIAHRNIKLKRGGQLRDLSQGG